MINKIELGRILQVVIREKGTEDPVWWHKYCYKPRAQEAGGGPRVKHATQVQVRMPSSGLHISILHPWRDTGQLESGVSVSLTRPLQR